MSAPRHGDAYHDAVRGRPRWFRPSRPGLDDEAYRRELEDWRARQGTAPEQAQLDALFAELEAQLAAGEGRGRSSPGSRPVDPSRDRREDAP